MIINMTPHPVTILDENNTVIRSIDSNGTIRLKASTEFVKEVDGVKMSKTVYGEPVGLPEYSEGTYYIVSQLVKTALPERRDLLVPAEMVRDENNQIIGCRSLGM